MGIECVRSGGRLIVVVEDDLDIASVRAAVAAIDEAVSAGGDRLVIDVSGLGLVDSSGLGTIVYALKRASAAGMTLVVAGEHRALDRRLRMTGLDRAVTRSLRPVPRAQG